MNETIKPVSRGLRVGVGLTLAACYLTGLALMFMAQMGAGLLLWVISTVGGGGFLYYLRQRERRLRQASQARKGKEQECG